MKYPVEKSKREMRREKLEEIGYRIGVTALGIVFFSSITVAVLMFIVELMRAV